MRTGTPHTIVISIAILLLCALPGLCHAQDAPSVSASASGAVTGSTTGNSSAPATTADPFAFTPTGDALWDAYAQAVLDQLAKVPDNPGALATAGMLPQDMLDGWEDQFGSDPRYWELCYWNARANSDSFDDGYLRSARYLNRSVELGVADSNTLLLLYTSRRWRLRDVWEALDKQDPSVVDLSPIDWVEGGVPSAPTQKWFEDQDLAIAHWQAEACPGEAWAHYNLAMKLFEYGEWEDGLSELDAGNAAPSAVMPVPFPVSYYIDHTADGSGMGNTMLAGVLAGYATMEALPNFMMMKDHVKEQQQRVLMGADWRELGPWYRFSVHLGMMQRSTPIQWLVGVVLARLSLGTMLTDVPDALTPEQRVDVLELYARMTRVKELVKYDMNDYKPDMQNPPLLLASGRLMWNAAQAASPYLANYGGADIAPPQQVSLAELAAALAWIDQCQRAEFHDVAGDAHDAFWGYSHFDFERAAYAEP